jgi:subtilisin-like proprotein convertase family protein
MLVSIHQLFMNIFKLSAIGALLIAGSAGAQDKTANPVKIDPALIGQEPYRFNGLVLNYEQPTATTTTTAARLTSRGTGFCAWNRQVFFSAAHVVFQPDEDPAIKGLWLSPPVWAPTVNAADLDGAVQIQSRGYYRWRAYGDMSRTIGTSNLPTFGKDAILAYALTPLIPGSPAKLNLNGFADLQKKRSILITGYPAVNSYREQLIDGFFLHQTGPTVRPFSKGAGNALQNTLLSTGPGNSGGPVWTRKNASSPWRAAGIMVGGLPSEATVYAFAANTKSFLNAVKPVLKRKIGQPVFVSGVTSSTVFFPVRPNKLIPDGASTPTVFSIPVRGFAAFDTLDTLKLSLTIKTKHRGDLIGRLVAPSGATSLIYANLFTENGADADDIIYRDFDLKALLPQDLEDAFKATPPNGIWKFYITDRLKKDRARVKNITLEIGVIENSPPPPVVEPPITPSTTGS